LDSRAAETTNTVESLAENCKGKRLAIAPASLRAQHLADNLMQNGVEIGLLIFLGIFFLGILMKEIWYLTNSQEVAPLWLKQNY